MDQGRTWSSPAQIDIDPYDSAPKADRFEPSVAVSKGGVVGVSWHDRSGFPPGTGYAMRFRASLDGGMSFQPSVRVSEHGMTDTDNEIGVLAASARFGERLYPRPEIGGVAISFSAANYHFGPGDTQQMVAGADGIFHPFWIDNRTGMPQLWTAPVTVRGKASKYGDDALAGFEDVSGRVRLALSKTAHDTATHTMSVDVRLRNVSDSNLAGTLKFLVTELSSIAGTPHLLGAENGKEGVGAVLDFTGTLPNGSLAPGEESRPVRIRARVPDFSKELLHEQRSTYYSLMTLNGRVLLRRK
jgi:hypothetical protein